MDTILNKYANLKNLHDVFINNNIQISTYFYSENMIIYLNSDLILHKVTLFLLLIIMHTYISMLKAKGYLNFDKVKKLPFGNSIYYILIRLFNS